MLYCNLTRSPPHLHGEEVPGSDPCVATHTVDGLPPDTGARIGPASRLPHARDDRTVDSRRYNLTSVSANTT